MSEEPDPDPDDGSDDGDLPPEQEDPDAPEEETPDPGSDPTMPAEEGETEDDEPDDPTGRMYGLQESVETISTTSGPYPSGFPGPSVSIDGMQLEAVTELEVSGAGREKQYLTEIGSGGSGDGDEESSAGEESTSSDEGDAETGDTADAGSGSGDDPETPPLTLTITARVGHDAYTDLEALKEVREPFDVDVSGLSLDQMELADLQRDQSGDKPYTYGATIKVREYREKTIRLPTGGGGDGNDSTTGDETETDAAPDDTTADWIEEGDGGVSEAETDFETVEVSGQETVEVGGGETLENILYDVSDGGGVNIRAVGSDWTVKNIGVTGQHEGGYFAIVASVPDEDGSALIDNIYLGDGQQPRTSGGGIFLVADGENAHQGVITGRRLYIAEMVSHGLHASAPAEQGHTGKMDVQNSLFYSNNIANIRVGARDDRTTYLRNVVTQVDDSAIPECGDACSQPGGTRSRGLWTWHGTTEVINSDIHGDIETSEGGSNNFQDSREGDEAEARVPSGVPTTAEAAAGGDA